MEFLLNNNADIRKQNDQGFTVLHVACQIGWKEGVELLIRWNAMMVPDKMGNLPTHIAAQQNHREIILLFVQYKERNVVVGLYNGN